MTYAYPIIRLTFKELLEASRELSEDLDNSQAMVTLPIAKRFLAAITGASAILVKTDEIAGYCKTCSKKGCPSDHK